MDDGYECVPGCNYIGPPFLSRRSLSTHQRACEAAKAHRDRITALSAAADLAEDIEPPAKRLRIAEPDTEDNIALARPLSPGPTPTSPSSPVSRPVRVQPPPPRLTRAQARRLDSTFRSEHDAVPEAPAPLPALPTDNLGSSRLPAATTRPSRVRDPFRTEPDIFGQYRVYYSRPPKIPDANAPMAHIVPASDQNPSTSHTPRPLSDIISPCPNLSVFYVLRYHWLAGNTKSLNDRDYLCNEVILQPGFKPEDLIGVNLRAVDGELAAAANNWDPLCPPAEGWKNVPLQLRVPTPSAVRNQARKRKHPRAARTQPLPAPEPQPQDDCIDISGLRARSLTDLMKKTFSVNDVNHFHYEPYEHKWKPPGLSGPAQTLSGEMYTSPAMIKAHREVQNLDIDCDLPRCVAAFMFASDGMQFAQFSHVKGWPILCSFGNVSKYERCKPTSNTCHPVAHIPTLPDKVKEQITAMHGKPPTDTLLTHLRRELMHAVWAALLDDEFIEAWRTGVVINCADGVRRRVFPRILTYSADYPEKVLLATIRNNGARLCPRCFVEKTATSQMGTPTDMQTRKKKRIDNEKRRAKIEQARRLIYDQGKALANNAVEGLLKDHSYTPTMNAFSARLREFKFNFFATLVVDQLHEVELGVWKSLFQHLIRLLHLRGPAAVAEFNRRFRAVPTFASTIRKFAEDVADMGRIAARDFEDILQCCMPVFRGLLPETCDEPAQTLLFLFAEWHGLAKLRLHATATLKIFKSLTTKLGTALRNFVTLTKALEPRETPKEYTRRKKQAEVSKASSMSRRMHATTNTTRAATKATRTNKPGLQAQEKSDGDGRRIVTLNLNTYKTHSMGDYPESIEEYGTTDSYSTQIGELQNRKYKAQYMRTNKRGAIEQMTEIDDIMATLQTIDKELRESLKPPGPPVDIAAIDSITECQPYYIGQKERSEDMIPNISMWVANQAKDSAVKFFYPQLKRHLLARVRGVSDGTNFSDSELAQLSFHQGRMYRHKTLHVNYTSYDVLRQQDVLNAGTANCFVMLPAETNGEPGAHPFVYAKVLGVYHAKIVHGGRLPQRMDFVHVRWLYYDYERPGGWDHKRLDRVNYIACGTNDDILDSFDFIDPANILRATHLIPDFCSNTTKGLLNLDTSIAYDSANFGDWNAYYVNRFADRDILMRYVGGGVGHYRQTSNKNIQEVVPPDTEVQAPYDNTDENEEDEEVEEAADAEDNVEDNVEDNAEDEEGDADEEEDADEVEEDVDADDMEDAEMDEDAGEVDNDAYDDLCGF
ncbi:hypothetical protein FRC08_004728 [Ceratobasidium sp. 394]|nr:hypothetical protein FRC08_004728 [Ceratobasidium sp. 394]KAG9092590.1 hypothetical protein FS749_015603 [Ceratobasidium sp. UAMH 11750]